RGSRALNRRDQMARLPPRRPAISRIQPWLRSAGQLCTRHRSSKRESIELGRQRARLERNGLRGLRLPLRVTPQLESMSLTDENNVFVEARVASQRGGNENAARAVELDVVSVADEQPLQIADLLVERREPHDSPV